MSEEIKDPAEVAKPQAEAVVAEAAVPQAQAEAVEPEAAAPQAQAEAAAPQASLAPADDDDAVLNAAGRERPRFLLGFPQHPDLARLSAAFEAGNYALVREEAEALAERTENPAVRDAALELRRRIDPDPLAKYLLAITAALLVALAYFAYHP